MLDTLKKLGVPVFVPVLALGLACFAGAGCIDNSGNKTYPRGDAGFENGAADAPAPEDVATDAGASDTPADALAGDVPAVDALVTDAPALDAVTGDVALPTDARADSFGN
jgi:hypothetical protein